MNSIYSERIQIMELKKKIALITIGSIITIGAGVTVLSAANASTITSPTPNLGSVSEPADTENMNANEANDPADTNEANDPADTNEANDPADTNEANDPADANEANDPADANEGSEVKDN
jgi:hypothetical protein